MASLLAVFKTRARLACVNEQNMNVLLFHTTKIYEGDNSLTNPVRTQYLDQNLTFDSAWRDLEKHLRHWRVLDSYLSGAYRPL